MEKKDFTKKEIIEVQPKIRQPMKVPGRNIFINTLNIVTSPVKPLGRRYQTRWHQGKHHFVLDTFLILIILTLIAVNSYFFITYKNLIAGDRGIDLNLALPSAVTSGQEITLEIAYGNNKNLTLNQTELELLYPSGFVFSKSLPEPEPGTNNLWELGAVETGGVGIIKVTGRIFGEVPKSERFSTILRFFVGRSQVLSQQVKVKKIIFNDSNFSLDFYAPEAVLKNRTESYTVAYNFSGELNHQPVKIDLILPTDFNLTASQPQLTDKNQWLLGELTGTTTGEVSFSGFFTADEESSKEFSANLFLALGDNWYQQVKAAEQVKIIKPTVEISYQADHLVADWGDSINYTAKIKNTGDSQLADLTLRMIIDPQYYDLNQSELAGAKIENKKIIWGQQSNTIFSLLDPGKEVNFNFQLKLKSVAPSDSNVTLASRVELYSQKAGEFIKGVFLGESSVVNIKLNSPIIFSSVGRMFGPNGEQFGFGPVPPKVNLPSSYRIFWTISGNTNELKEAKVYATLPGSVKWTGIASISGGQEISFDQVSRTVSWDIGSLPINSQNQLQASFLLSVTPNSQQIGLVLPLINHSIFQAKDGFTGSKLERRVGGVTTDIPGDPQVAGQGRVVK